MGLFDKILGNDSEPDQETKEDESYPELAIDYNSLSRDGFTHGEYQGENIVFEKETSPNGDWICLYTQSGGTNKLPVVLLDRDEQVQFTLLSEQPLNAAVSNTGDVAVTETIPADQGGNGNFTVVDKTGNTILSHNFDANIDNCAISDSGAYVSTSTYNPDRTVYIFDTEKGQIEAKFETEMNSPAQEFDKEDGDLILYLLDNNQRYRGLSIDGETVWRSEQAKNDERVSDLLEASEDANATEVVGHLQEAYEIVEDKNEKKRIARDLADAYWNLANEIRKEKGDTDEWWSQLNQAKRYYFDIISWRDGQRGVAKIQRKQAKYHLKEEDEEQALELLQNIGDLGNKHDIDLLTDADKDKIENLK